MPIQNNQRVTTRDNAKALVFGATGQQGGAVAQALLARSQPVRIIVRNPDAAAAMALAAIGAEVVRGDLRDADSVRSAMIGVDRVFSVQPNSGIPGSGLTDADEVRFGKLVADAAVEAGISHLVYSSASVISRGATGISNLDCKLAIEDHVRGLSIPATILRPATFMELLARPDFWPDRDTLSFFVGADRPAELIAVDDIGKIAAEILGDRERFAGRSINIAGDELSGAEIAGAISRALARPINYRRFPQALLNKSTDLAKTVAMFEAGGGSAHADIPGLTREFSPLTDFEAWLSRTGKALVQMAADGLGR